MNTKMPSLVIISVQNNQLHNARCGTHLLDLGSFSFCREKNFGCLAARGRVFDVLGWKPRSQYGAYICMLT